MLDVPDELKKVRDTAGYQRAKALLRDPEWRLDNLYWIKDENGDEIRFVRNEAQRSYSEAMWSRDLIVKARRLGFSTFIGIRILDTCLFERNVNAAIIDSKLDSAKEKLSTIKFAYDRLAVRIREACPLIRNNTEELQWANGSKVSVGTSYRGGGLHILHVSEYGKVSIDTPEVAKEIKTGSMRAVPATGFIAVESTAHGTAGEFYDMVRLAQARQQENAPMTALDFRLHFYGWWIKKEHRVPNNLVVISQELREYFAEVAPKLLARHNVRLDADQMAWYAKQYADLGPDAVKEEFPTVSEETFFNSLLGAYWKAELSKARQDGRIGKPLPFDPTRRVNTFMDIGEDCTAVIFHQTDGVRHRFIDYWEENGSSLQRMITMLDEKKAQRGFSYDRHYAPHDIENRDWGNNSQTRKATAMDLGYKLDAVPRVQVKADSIEAARRMLNLSYFDSEHCGLLVERLDNYRRRWNKALGVFMAEHVHDAASHPADALQQGAMGLAPEKPEEDRHRRRERPKRSAWGA
jgi:hypothetical protein